MTRFLICQQAKGLCPHLCDGYSLPARPFFWLLLTFRPLPSILSNVRSCPLFPHTQNLTSYCLQSASYRPSSVLCALQVLTSNLTTILWGKDLLWSPFYKCEATCPGSVNKGRSWDSNLGDLAAQPTLPPCVSVLPTPHPLLYEIILFAYLFIVCLPIYSLAP